MYFYEKPVDDHILLYYANIIVTLLIMSNGQLIIGNGIDNTWNDDFQYDMNGLFGWNIVKISGYDIPITNPMVIVSNTPKFHGPFPQNYGLERYFQCNTSNDTVLYASYRLSYCNTDRQNDISIMNIKDTTSGNNILSQQTKLNNNALLITDPDLTAIQNATLNYYSNHSSSTINVPYCANPPTPTATPTPSPTYYLDLGQWYIRQKFSTFSVTITGNRKYKLILEINIDAPDEYVLIGDVSILCIDKSTQEPTMNPSSDLSSDPTTNPSTDPTMNPSVYPTLDSTIIPSANPSTNPTIIPTINPSINPSTDPTIDPTIDPTAHPTVDPTADLTSEPTIVPTADPTMNPTSEPTFDPTNGLTVTKKPTIDPTVHLTKYVTTDLSVASTANLTPSPSLDASSSSFKTLTDIIVIVATIIASIIVIGIIFGLILCWKKRKKHTNTVNKHIAATVSPIIKEDNVKKNNSVQMEMTHVDNNKTPTDLDKTDSNESLYYNPNMEQPTDTKTGENTVNINIVKKDDIEIDLNQDESNEDLYDNHDRNVRLQTTTNNDKQYVVDWTTKDLLDWILKLENGRYAPFKEKLYDGFNHEKVDGKNIKDVNEQDLRYYGMNILSERKDLMKQIDNLINSELYEPQHEGQTETISNGDNV